ncbi:MAG TPA: OsmC family protein, partial [Burkholderiales bacterium]|nr:OsmC family protein [Burkholderiales bacterium]
SHQKEAVVSEGSHGSSWRMVSDEGVHIKGDDLAPFPLGFFNAGLQADLANRVLALARVQGVVLDGVKINCRTGYSMTGAFFRGDGVGYAEPAKITVALRSAATAATISSLVAAAVRASPALAAMSSAVANIFAIYVNGKRRPVTTLPGAGCEDAADPLKTYASVPKPPTNPNASPDLILKTGQKREGAPTLTAPAATPDQRIVREVAGICRVSSHGETDTDVALQLPGMSHFAIKSDESAADRAPSGLALLSAGIAFCYMTQLSRYIDYMKYKIRDIRLVQFNPYTFDGALGGIEPVATHLFLHGDESDETHEKFMRISAATCFLHATLKTALTPDVAVELNDFKI